jgi:uncharacterized membrane protein YeiH
VATLALVSGLGGGIIRDTLLQHGPPLALVDPSYLFTCPAGGVVRDVLLREVPQILSGPRL